MSVTHGCFILFYFFDTRINVVDPKLRVNNFNFRQYTETLTIVMSSNDYEPAVCRTLLRVQTDEHLPSIYVDDTLAGMIKALHAVKQSLLDSETCTYDQAEVIVIERVGDASSVLFRLEKESHVLNTEWHPLGPCEYCTTENCHTLKKGYAFPSPESVLSGAYMKTTTKKF